MSEEKPSSVAEQPPSAKLVYVVLEHRGPLTQKQLIDETMLSPRTVRYALSDLDDAGLITETIYLADARQSLYELADDAPHPRQPTGDAGQPAQSSTGTSDD